MVDVNVNAPADQAPTMAPPTCTDDQIMPRIRSVPIGKSNCYLDIESFGILFDMTKPSDVTSVNYMSNGSISPKTLSETQITPVNNNNAFSSLTTPDALINFVNDQGYPKVIRNLSNVMTNDMFQLWRALTTIINLCLTGKSSGFERPRASIASTSSTHDQILHFISLMKNLFLDISSEPYYKEYLEKVAKHQRYLSCEKGSDPDSLILKPAKATKKSKPSAPKADLRLPVTKSASSQQAEPKPAPAKSLRLVDESVDEGIPEKEPRFDDEEADVQRALEESLKSVYDAPRGPLPLVVIREPNSGKYQPLPKVQGKGKEKVSDEQVALDLLTLQTPKKKSPSDQFIFQRRTSTPTESYCHDEPSSLYAELGLKDSEVKSDEDVPGIDAGVQDEGQAGPNPGEQDEGQVRPNPGDAAESQPQSSPVVHAGLNLEQTDLEATNVSTQPHLSKWMKGSLQLPT
nr:hypothetical protein [Tanacetum cinerariifolium]